MRDDELWSRNEIIFKAATHVLPVVHSPHVGVVAPVAQDDARVCVMGPVCPAGQLTVCVCDDNGVHVEMRGARRKVYEPLSMPFVHVRVCWTQVPAATFAVCIEIDALCAMV